MNGQQKQHDRLIYLLLYLGQMIGKGQNKSDFYKLRGLNTDCAQTDPALTAPFPDAAENQYGHKHEQAGRRHIFNDRLELLVIKKACERGLLASSTSLFVS